MEIEVRVIATMEIQVDVPVIPPIARGQRRTVVLAA